MQEISEYKYLDLPLLGGNPMIRILSMIALICGATFAVPDSTQIKVLSARVDSLSSVLHDAQLSATYAEKTLDATKDANENVKSQFGYFIAGIVGLLAIVFVALGYFLYQRSKEERDAIAIQVREMVNPSYNSRMESLNNEITKVATRLDDLNRSHVGLESSTKSDIKIANSEIALIKDGMRTIGTQNKLIEDLYSRVISVEIGLVFEKHAERMKEIDEALKLGKLSSAFNQITRGMEENTKGQKINHIYSDFNNRLISIFISAKKIIPGTKSRVESWYPLFDQEECKELKAIVDKIPVLERTGLLSLSDTFLTDQGAI